MKRSEINKALRELEAMCREYRCYLPPFCHFTPEDWQKLGHEYDEVRDCMLGWDITDYGMGDFDRFGFSLITIRNGNRAMADKYPKVYAEKLSSTAAAATCSAGSTTACRTSRSTATPPSRCIPTGAATAFPPARRSV